MTSTLKMNKQATAQQSGLLSIVRDSHTCFNPADKASAPAEPHQNYSQLAKRSLNSVENAANLTDCRKRIRLEFEDS
jgi:hypothetical protein